MGRYRIKDDFKVTTFDLCPVCNTLKEEVSKRREYVYRHGWVEIVSCYPCFKQTKDAAERDAADHFIGWDSV